MVTNRGETEPILATWKVGAVLRRYPETLDIFIDASPAFARLRNPVWRRVQARLVTVAQAARIAGLDPAVLVARLNAVIGLSASPTPAPPAESAPDVPSLAGLPVACELDARPYQERGEEPFSAIMAAIRQVPVGQVFRLRNTFEPVPLYEVLSRRGFVATARQLGPDDWEVLFLNTGQPRGDGEISQPPVVTGWAAPDATVTIDVRELVPPEPLVKILEALAALPPGATLLVRHVRRPLHLYPRLDALGYRHETREPTPGRVEILIEKPAGAPAGEHRS